MNLAIPPSTQAFWIDARGTWKNARWRFLQHRPHFSRPVCSTFLHRCTIQLDLKVAANLRLPGDEARGVSRTREDRRLTTRSRARHAAFGPRLAEIPWPYSMTVWSRGCQKNIPHRPPSPSICAAKSFPSGRAFAGARAVAAARNSTLLETMYTHRRVNCAALTSTGPRNPPTGQHRRASCGRIDKE